MRALVCALVGAALALPAPGLAQNCPEPESTLDSQVFPRSPTGLAPTDTLIWYLTDNRLATHEGIQRALTVVSLGGDGEVDVEPAGAAIAGDRGLFAFRPLAPLEPMTDYEIQYPVHPLGNDLAVTTFRTDFDGSGEAPPVPRLEDTILASDYSLLGDWCSSQDYRDEALFLLDSAAPFDVAGRSGVGWTFAEDPFADPLGAIGAGRVSVQNDVAPLDSMTVRFGSLDLAGRFSGWSDEVEVTMPASGCRSEGGEIGWAGLALLGLPGWTRRRRRRTGPPRVGALVLLIALATPTLAMADDPPMIDVPATVPAPPEAPPEAIPSWRVAVERRAQQDLGVMGAIGLTSGVIDTITFAALPGRGHGALQVRLVNVVVSAPTLGSLAVIGGVRQALRDKRSGRRLARGLRGAAVTLVSVAIPITAVMSVGATQIGFADPAVGAAFFTLPASLWGVATTLMAYDQLVREVHGDWKDAREGRVTDTRRRLRPRLVAAGPTGFSFVF